MILLCIPVLFIYFSFFANAFILDSTGELTLQNFQFLYQPIQLSQYTVEPIGKAFRNTVIFTAIATTLEVTISCMAGYALARMEFTGKRVISFSLLTLRLFPGVLLLIGVLYVLLHLGMPQHPHRCHRCGNRPASARQYLHYPQLLRGDSPGY